MKKITLLVAFFVSALTLQAQITLTQSTDNVITGTNSVGCPSGDNFWARNFILADFGITDTFQINTGEIGVQSADLIDNTVTVNIYTSDSNFPASFNSAVLLGSQIVTIPVGSDLSIVNYTFDVPVIVPAGTEGVLVEVNSLLDNTMFIGGTVGETDPSYLKSETCATPEYVTTSDIGFPTAHFYITVTGEELLGMNDNLSSMVSVYPVPVTNVLNVKLPSNVEVNRATLVDVLGKTTGAVYSKGEMNVSGLASGIYILKLETNFGSYTQKVIKQ